MRYWPVPSLTALRTFSMRTGLDASTVTPGSSAPDVSLTVPVMVACAQTTAGANRITNAAVAGAHARANLLYHENDSMLLTSLYLYAFACRNAVRMAQGEYAHSCNARKTIRARHVS